MDQMASAMGREARAMFLDTRTLEIQYAPVPDGVSVVLCDTKKPRALTDSAYNERRSQCEEASRILGVPKLRDATLEMLEAKKGEMSEVVYRRARHVITENNRVLDAVEALEKGKLDAFGKLMNASHASMRDDYQVSTPEIDVLADLTQRHEGVFGARLTGGGFGGCVVSVMAEDAVASYEAKVVPAYEQATGKKSRVFVCKAVQGASVLWSPMMAAGLA